VECADEVKSSSSTNMCFQISSQVLIRRFSELKTRANECQFLMGFTEL